jgi:hypothetical protein
MGQYERHLGTSKMTNWTKGTSLHAEAEQELLEMLLSDSDVAITISRDASRPAPMRWGVTGDGATGFGATFAEAWHGRNMAFDE